jgi:uncharacterized membrane protein YkoI
MAWFYYKIILNQAENLNFYHIFNQKLKSFFMNRVAIFLFTLILGVAACKKNETIIDVTPDETLPITTVEIAAGAGGGGTVIPDTEMPQTVKDAIATAYAGFTITKVERDTERNVVVFEIHINNGTQKKTLIYSKEWKLVVVHIGGDHHTGGDRRDTIIAHTGLPKTVKDSIAKYYAALTIVKITQERRNGVIYFEIEFKNAKGKKTLIFDILGHIRKEEVEEDGPKPVENKDGEKKEGLKLSEISALVKAYVKANYAGYVIEDVEKVVKNKVTTFEVEIKMGKVEKTLIFDANWVFVKVK